MDKPASVHHRLGTWLPAVIALVAPIAVVWLGVSVMMGFGDEEEELARANAGRVINGVVVEAGSVAAMDRMLEQRQPEVVLLGPSYANTDIDDALLAKRLHISRDDMVKISIPNSIGSHWYAILKHRVFEGGHRPRMVVIVSGLQSMLLTRPLSESSWMNLAVHLEGQAPDPVLQEKARWDAGLALAGLREQRGVLRGRVLDGLRRLPTETLFSSPRDPARAMSEQEARVALGQVFDDANVRMALHVASLPVAGSAPAERAYDAALLPSPDASMLREVTELVRGHGAQILWVRPPMSPHIPAHLDDVVLEGVQDESRRLIGEAGGHYLDMRSLPMTEAMFKNEDHMNEEGSRRFTEALSAAVGDLAQRAREVQAKPPEIARMEGLTMDRPEGLPEAMSAGPWLAPGAELLIATDEPWTPSRGPFTVSVALRAESASSGRPTATLSGARLPLSVSTEGVETRRVDGQKTYPHTDAPWSLRVTSPDTLGWSEVVAVRVGEGRDAHYLVGDALQLEGATASLFGLTQLKDGVYSDISVRPTYPKPPGDVPKADRPLVDAPGKMARMESPRWAFLSDEELIGATRFGSRCSPLRVLEDGVPLSHPNVPCVDVKNQGNGRTCHMPESLFVSASDETDPMANGRRYVLGLDPERMCDGAAWLYPADRFEVMWPDDRLEVLDRGARRLTIGGRYLQQRKTRLTVRLRVGSQVRLEEEVDGRRLKSGPLTWVLDPPVKPSDGKIVLEMENHDYVFYLIDEATLSER